MKKLFLFVFAALAFAACEQAPIEEQSAILQDATKSITVGFEGDDDTRIQLNEAQKTVWTEGDHVSVFYRSSVNEEWQFMGKTGDRTGQIVPVDNSVNPPATHNRVVVIYPYNNEYYLNTETYSIEASLPAVQSYLEDSYGTNGNIMVSSNDYKQVSLKSVCGWLKLQLTGDGEVVKSITLRGNNGEQVAGELHINTSDATCVLASASGDAGDSEVGGTLVRPGTILTEVTLDCGEGVALGKNATAFYIALPPQTFEKGFTVDIECDGYKPMTLSTTNTHTIERNHIQPMASVEHNATPVVPNNQIWYTSSDGDVVTPYDTNAFGTTIISNEYNNGKGVITFDGDVTSIGNYAFSWCTSLTSVNIPDSVTQIEEYAFHKCTSLTSVNIPDSLTTIGEWAFASCTSLTSVNIPDSVTTIGMGAFESCDSLTSVNIPDSVTTIVGFAFAYCDSLTSVNIPDSVTTIGDLAFYSCTSLTSVNIPDSVTTIEDGVFGGCKSLTSVNIPDSVTTIGNSAFEDCTSLTSVYCKAATPPALGGWYVFYNNGSGRKIYVPAESVEAYKSAEYWSEYASAIVGYDFENGEIVEMQPNNEIWYTNNSTTEPTEPYKSDAFGANIISNTYNTEKECWVIKFDGDLGTIGESAFYNSNIVSIFIPDSVSTMGGKVFYGCQKLTEVKLSKNITKIAYDAFNLCINLENIDIHEGVTIIDNRAFQSCSKLSSVLIPDSVTTINEDAFSYCSNLNSVIIGNSVETIGDSAFYNCKNLTSLIIPDSVKSIGDYAFYQCNKLSSLNLGNSLTKIGAHAFQFCKSLTEVTIPNSVTTMDVYCFEYCENLTSVTIGNSVADIKSYAFYNCDKLTNIYCKATTPPHIDYHSVLSNDVPGRNIYVPAGSVNAYKTATYWKNFADAIVGYDFENGVVVE